MRKFLTILLATLLTIIAGTAAGKVIIKERPMEWQDVAHVDGGALYNNLCASCHGVGGRGDGPAVSALDKDVPDLTVLAAKNGGVYMHNRVKLIISGESRELAHGTIDMPLWGQQFMYVRPGWSKFQREAFARRKISSIDRYVESLQESRYKSP